MQRTAVTCAIFFSCSLLACEPAATDRDASSAAGTDPIKKNPKTCLNIVNGEETTSRPEVGFIFSNLGNNETGGCTGTFVSPNTMITAAHCIEDGIEPHYVKGSSFDMGDGNAIDKWTAEAPAVKEVIVSQLESEGGSIRSDKTYKDIAVIIFEEDIAPAVMPLLGRTPAHDEKVELMGFGVTTALENPPPQKSVKRRGYNTVVKSSEIDATYKDSIVIVGAAETDGSDKALTGHGDSGGPLIVDGAIAGVCSNGGDLSGDVQDLFGDAEAITSYANLNSSYAREFLKEAEDSGAVFFYVGDELPAMNSSDESDDGDDDTGEEACE